MLGTAQDAGERLDVGGAGVVERVGQLEPARCADALGEASRHDRRLRKLLARRLVPAQTAGAGAAAGVVDQRHPSAVSRDRDHLVPEHRPGHGDADLLDVRTAQPAGENGDEVAGRRRLDDVCESWLSIGA